jgi:hypothetical protein
MFSVLKVIFQGCAIAQAVNSWPLTLKARVRSKVNPWVFVVVKVALEEFY